MSFYLLLLNALSYGMLLFVMTSGLTLIFGVMRTLNLAHGSFYMLGFYIALSSITWTNNFLLAAVAGACAAGIIGMVVQRFLLSKVPLDPSPQTLLTIGILYVLSEMFLIIWGGTPRMLPIPAVLTGSVAVGNLIFPMYRLALTVVGFVIAILLWLFIEKTKWGAILRAGADNLKMAEAIGINMSTVWMMVFGLGIFVAGLAGALGGPIWGGYPGQDWELLLLALVIVITAGLGSLKGALVMSIAVGLITNIGNMLFPEAAMFILFAMVAIVLIVRTRGLFGGIKY